MINEKLKIIYNHFGEETQKAKATEESAELIRAIAKEDHQNMLEELADIGVIVSQFLQVYPEIADIMKAKVDRTILRIEENYYG